MLVWLRRLPAASIVAMICLCLFVLIGHRAFAQTALPLHGQVVFDAGQRIAPDFALEDQYGHVMALHQLRGRVVVLTFLSDRCTQQCPIIGREMALVQRQLGSSVPWTLLAVSTAPLTDTPAGAVTFAIKSGWQGDWHWLFGTPTQLAMVWRAYGIWVQPEAGAILHTAALYIVSPTGEVRIADMVPFVPNQMTESIRSLTGKNDPGWLHWPSWL